MVCFVFYLQGTGCTCTPTLPTQELTGWDKKCLSASSSSPTTRAAPTMWLRYCPFPVLSLILPSVHACLCVKVCIQWLKQRPKPLLCIYILKCTQIKKYCSFSASCLWHVPNQNEPHYWGSQWESALRCIQCVCNSPGLNPAKELCSLSLPSHFRSDSLSNTGSNSEKKEPHNCTGY